MTTTIIVERFLRALQPCSDAMLEVALANAYRTKPSTVRGARKRLERMGIVCQAGRCKDGRKRWKLA